MSVGSDSYVVVVAAPASHELPVVGASGVASSGLCGVMSRVVRGGYSDETDWPYTLFTIIDVKSADIGLRGYTLNKFTDATMGISRVEKVEDAASSRDVVRNRIPEQPGTGMIRSLGGIVPRKNPKHRLRRQ